MWQGLPPHSPPPTGGQSWGDERRRDWRLGSDPLGRQTLKEPRPSSVKRGDTKYSVILPSRVLTQPCNRKDEGEIEKRTSCLYAYLGDAGIKAPFPDPLGSSLGLDVPSVVETEESQTRALLQSVVDRSTWHHPFSRPRGDDLSTILCPHMPCPFRLQHTPFPCLLPSSSPLFWVPGFIEMLCSHNNQMPLSLPLPEPEMTWG